MVGTALFLFLLYYFFKGWRNRSELTRLRRFNQRQNETKQRLRNFVYLKTLLIKLNKMDLFWIEIVPSMPHMWRMSAVRAGGENHFLLKTEFIDSWSTAEELNRYKQAGEDKKVPEKVDLRVKDEAQAAMFILEYFEKNHNFPPSGRYTFKFG